MKIGEMFKQFWIVIVILYVFESCIC